MATARAQIRFILNDQDVVLTDVGPSDTLLDYLRLEMRLRGTKEGCAEGDCGACTVLVGRLAAGGLVYEAVNACIRFVASLDGCHIVTVEHLAGADGALHPVQQAFVDEHGSQCGFCTPGFVMSLYGLWMRQENPSVAEIEQALQGNLCRCTGYAPIIKAAQAITPYGTVAADALVAERDAISGRLKALADGARVDMTKAGERLILPANVDDLAKVMQAHPKAVIVAGATDVGLWVTKFMRPISPAVFTGHLRGLHGIEEDDTGITIGAGVTYTELEPVITARYPQLRELWSRIGGEQVRNMGTIGGNVANGSPIGDTPPVLIALGATVTLRRGDDRRQVPIGAFFIAYGKQDRQPGDFLESIRIPDPEPGDHFAAYKISKRRDEDISSVLGAFRVALDGDKVRAAILAYGGMAATPKRAAGAEAALMAHGWSAAGITAAQMALMQDFEPLSDWRASASYRSLVAGNLLRRFYLDAIGEPTRLAREDVA
jgi:xanthine dehydrogenase small subunit